MSSNWTESSVETVSLVLAVFVGIWEEDLVTHNPVMLWEIQAALGVPTFLVLLVLAKFRKSQARKLLKLVLKALNWVTAVLAGSLFAYDYNLLTTYLLIGVLFLVPYIFVVAALFGWIKSIQSNLDLKEQLGKGLGM